MVTSRCFVNVTWSNGVVLTLMVFTRLQAATSLDLILSWNLVLSSKQPTDTKRQTCVYET